MQSIREAVDDGDRREALVRLAERLAERLDDDGHNVHAQLAAQFRATLAEIDELDGAEPVEPEVRSPLDEIRARRETRDGTAAGGASSG